MVGIPSWTMLFPINPTVIAMLSSVSVSQLLALQIQWNPIIWCRKNGGGLKPHKSSNDYPLDKLINNSYIMFDDIVVINGLIYLSTTLLHHYISPLNDWLLMIDVWFISTLKWRSPQLGSSRSASRFCMISSSCFLSWRLKSWRTLWEPITVACDTVVVTNA